MTADGAVPDPSSEERAFDQMRAGRFPVEWNLIPVAGKETYEKNWANTPLTREACEVAYKLNRAYGGLGVVTGSLSGGLIALDVDGSDADDRYREAAGAEYEPYGEERTMAWTSGKPGRRQLLYKVPDSLLPQLEHVTTVIARADGGWHLGSADKKRTAKKAQGDQAPSGAEYQELVLRLNHCQSVLPGSPHPETKQPYRWLAYNDGVVAFAPEWVVDLLRGFRKPSRWLSEADLAKMPESTTFDTAVNPQQIRGWFFKEEVQAKLMPRLQDLVFKHEAFDTYGWRERGGTRPQFMSGCPWHGGSSGTSFQVHQDSGCWDCKACGVGGDVLDFIHKIAVNDAYASRPQGADLEKYVAQIATELGYRYPEDLEWQVVVEAPRTVMDEREFHEALITIHDEERNPALRLGRMAALAQETGRRLSGKDCLGAMDEYRYYKQARAKNDNNNWWENLQGMQHVVPNLLMAPSQVILHAAGGFGKTSACMGLATAIGRGRSMKIRGIEVPVRQGPVLWIQNDQNPEKLLRDCQDNGIDPAKDKWFQVRRGFQMNHTHEVMEWIREIRPVLTVVDSIGSSSTKMQIEEKDKAFAHPLYLLGEMNGDPVEGFPATVFIWIHHDNAKGDVRGTKYLVNAVDEQWHLRVLTDQERETLRQKNKPPSNCRMIQIKKSRLGRQGDLLVVERDRDFAYSVEDYTPTVRREDDGDGDPEPHTMMLDIVKQSSLAGEGPLTAKEVWEVLVEDMGHQNREAPSQRTVKRHLNRWAQDGMLVFGKKKKEGKGLSDTYSLARGVQQTLSIVHGTPKTQTTTGFNHGQPESVSMVPESVPPTAAEPINHGQPESVSMVPPPETPCSAGDVVEPRTMDTSIRSTRAGDGFPFPNHPELPRTADISFDLERHRAAFFSDEPPIPEEGDG